MKTINSIGNRDCMESIDNLFKARVSMSMCICSSAVYSSSFRTFQKPQTTGVFTEDADIEAKGTGVKVSADDLDVLLADIEKLTREE